MTSYTLVKGKIEVTVRMYADRAELVRRVDGSISTSRPEMTPLEANREVTSLLRAGYKRVASKAKAAKKE